MEGLGKKPGLWYLAGGLLVAAGLGIWAGSQTTPTTRMPHVIAGRVSAPTGQPVAQARVYFRQGPVPLPDIATLTDARGTFTLTAPVVGSYQLGCTADGFAPATLTVQVPAGGQAVQVEIGLR